MKKVIYLTIMFLMISLKVSAQASGGQITRKKANTTTAAPKKTTPTPKKTTSSAKTHSSGKTRSNEIRKEQSSSNYTPPTIQTEPRSNIVGKYHLVIGSFSIGANAQDLCNRMKERGYSSFVYYSIKKRMYRVIVASSYSEPEIIRLLKDLRKEYDSCWIAYIDDVEDYALTNNGLVPF